MGGVKKEWSQNLATGKTGRQDTIKGISQNGKWQRYDEEEKGS